MSDTTGQKAAGQDEAAADQDGKAEEPADDVVTTRHAITIDGAELRYTVTAGRVVLRQEGHTDDKFDGAQAKAEVFMVAYTLDDADAASRPVTFAFNGGPGSAEFTAGNDEPYPAYLPTYAAIAHYHGRLAQSARLAAFVRGGHEAR